MGLVDEAQRNPELQGKTLRLLVLVGVVGAILGGGVAAIWGEALAGALVGGAAGIALGYGLVWIALKVLVRFGG